MASCTEHTEEQTIYTLILECTSTKESSPRTKTLGFSSSPRTVADIKAQIQKDCQIPVTLQTILFGSTAIDSSTDLPALRLRNNDTLTVKYFATAECDQLDKCIKWLHSLVEAFTKYGVPVTETGVHPTVQNLLDVMVEEEQFIADLAFQLFMPWMKPEVYANKIYFIDNHGLNYLMELYSLLLSQSWDNLLLKLQITQCTVLCALWNFAENFHLRREILKRDGLQKCIKSLVQVHINPNSLENSRQLERASSVFLYEAIGAALGTLSNLCELPETHLTLASNREVIQQMMNVITSKLFDLRTVQMVSILLLVLSYTSGTHEYLLLYNTIKHLMCAEYTKGDELLLKNQEEPLLMNYHRATYFAQLFLVSFRHFTQEQTEIVQTCLSQFVTTADPEVLRQAEIDELYIWATFLPYIKLFYIPASPPTGVLGEIIRIDSLRVILIALENMLGRENHRDILKHEGLLDFVVCMPWHVSGVLYERTQKLVRMIQSSPDVQLQPPSLVNITKAAVAKSYCGLEQVLELSVPELLMKIC